MKRFALHAATALATLAGVLLLWRFREGLLLLALSLAAAATARPAVRRLTVHRVPRGLAIALVYGTVVVLYATLAVLIGGPLLADAQQGANDLVRVYERLETAGPAAGGLRGMLIHSLPPATELYRAIVGGAWAATIGVVGIVGRAVIVLVLAIYWTVDQDAFERVALSLAPSEVRARATAVWRSIEAAVGARLRSEIGQSLMALPLLALFFRVIGLEHPTLPAVIGATTRFVPIVGAPLAVLTAFAAGAVTGPGRAFAAAGCALGTMVLLTHVVAPRFAAARRQNAIIQLVTMIVLVDAHGLVGLVAAAPLAVALDVLGNELARRPRNAPGHDEGHGRLVTHAARAAK